MTFCEQLYESQKSHTSDDWLAFQLVQQEHFILGDVCISSVSFFLFLLDAFIKSQQVLIVLLLTFLLFFKLNESTVVKASGAYFFSEVLELIERRSDQAA